MNLDPLTIALMLGFASGLAVGRSFKGIDKAVQDTQGFKSLGVLSKWFVKSYLDCFHHWQIGLVIMFFAKLWIQYDPTWQQLWYTFGLGLFTADAADYKNLIRRYSSVKT